MVGVNTSGTGATAFKRRAVHVGRQDRHRAAVRRSSRTRSTRTRSVAERLKDHAWFIAFAPADHPKIALAVLVENGGFGAAAAAPIARRAIDYYLLGQLAGRPEEAGRGNVGRARGAGLT